MEKEKELLISLNKKINTNNVKKFYINNFEVNNLILKLLDENQIELSIDLSKNNNQILMIHIISVFHKISLNLNLEFELSFTFPIYVSNKLVVNNFPVDWHDEIYLFKNGIFFNNLKNDIKTFLFNKGYSVFSSLFKETLEKNEIQLPFYYSNYPPKKIGYEIITIADDYYQYKKIFKPIDLKKIEKRKHTVNYLKWELTKDLSIRYFIIFEDDKEKEKKYFLKSHKKKFYILLKEEEAQHMLNQFKINDYINIVGFFNGKDYIKIKSNSKGKIINGY